MPKFTKRVKKNRKNRTFKSETIFNKIGGGDEPTEERKGVFNMIGDSLGNAASNLVDKAQDIGLNALGLEKIDKSAEESEATQKVNENLEKIGDAASSVVSNVSDTASGVMSDIGDVADKTSASIIDNLNEVLDSSVVSDSVKEAGEQTAEITGKLAESFNDAMDDPAVKAEVEEAIENAGEVATVMAKAAKEPIKEVARVTVEAGTDALGAASSGLIKVGSDMLAAIPGAGGIIAVGKMINDGSKAASAVVEASSEAVEVASDAFIDTKEKVEEDLKQLEEKKKMAEDISNRTTKSMTEFENPLKKVTDKIPETPKIGGHKTRRKLFKRKAKTKRVRFAT
jgi:hypothetical protein